MFRLFAPLRILLLAAVLFGFAAGSPARAEAFSLASITASVQELAQRDSGSLLSLWRWLSVSRYEVDLPIGIHGALAGAVLDAARAPHLTAFPIDGSFEHSSPFGYREHPLKKRRRFHSGIDFAADSGTSVVAAAPGRVLSAKWMGGYGRMVVIDHGNGVTTRYAHLRRIAVRKGATVSAGQRIGAVGSSGWATGPHLHFEVRADGSPIDPAPLLAVTSSD